METVLVRGAVSVLGAISAVWPEFAHRWLYGCNDPARVCINFALTAAACPADPVPVPLAYPQTRSQVPRFRKGSVKTKRVYMHAFGRQCGGSLRPLCEVATSCIHIDAKGRHR